ncbi:MAG: hypothetical protein NVS9B11_11790 [Candidatus Dormibacteraceae bacterium]
MGVRRHVALSTDYPAGEIVAAAQAAEARGVEGVWITDVRFMRDCYVLLGAIAATTTRISLAAGVSDPFSRHPASLAATAATLAELAPGRVILGLGAGGSGLDKIGVTRADPVRTVEAAITAMRALLRGDQASAETAGFVLHDGQLTFQPPQGVPIALVAHGPVMYRLAGRLADIAFIANYATPEAIAWARAQLEKGRASRTASDGVLREIWRVDVCVSPDGEAAREVMRRRIRSLLWSGYYGASFLKPLALDSLTGRGDVSDPDLDPLVDAVAFAGTAEDVSLRFGTLLASSRFSDICYRPYRVPGQTLPEATALVDEALSSQPSA